jgi:hypothetical protein
MLVTEDAFYQIIQDTWNSTLGFQVERLAGPEPPAAGAVTVCVRISGAWEGEVRLYCPLPLARSIAAVIFQVEPESVESDQVLDALSELVHIVGGNLKALLPQPVTLSLPALPDPTDWTNTTPQWQLVNRLDLTSQGQCFAVSLLGDLRPRGQVGSQVNHGERLGPRLA